MTGPLLDDLRSLTRDAEGTTYASNVVIQTRQAGWGAGDLEIGLNFDRGYKCREHLTEIMDIANRRLAEAGWRIDGRSTDDKRDHYGNTWLMWRIEKK